MKIHQAAHRIRQTSPQPILAQAVVRAGLRLSGWGVLSLVVGSVLLGRGLLGTGAELSAAEPSPRAFSTGSTDEVVEFLNQKFPQSWADNEVTPSPITEDGEWLRRVSLDIVGHIPTAEAVEKFVKDKDSAKRSRMIDQLLDDPAYVRNWTTIWTNHAIGQQTPMRVSREGMQKFFREAFGRNRPWNEIVSDLLTAEGHFEENGAVNYILAQMQDQDEAVQLTAKTARLFLGLQVQCTQCHNHPFNDWKQDQFWQYNAFFRQVNKIEHRKLDPQTGRQVDDYSEVVWRDFAGPVYYEQRSGVLKVAFPIYEGQEVDAGPNTERRKEFARLVISGERPQLAYAAVNRMWGHFLGAGFTRPLDDMGPHNPPTNPAVLDRLAEEFVKCGYDNKQLIRWIANSLPYQLSSQMTPKNDVDNPAAGETALFSRVYVKPMSAEQLYDSLIVATNAHKSGRGGWEESEKQRQEWLQQFVRAFGNDENEESSTFDGSIPQALMMMNGPLIQDAVAFKPGSHMAQIIAGRGTDAQKIQQLFLTVLSRQPTRQEIGAFQRVIKSSRDPLAVYQDIFWALLNSNEFIFVF